MERESAGCALEGIRMAAILPRIEPQFLTNATSRCRRVVLETV